MKASLMKYSVITLSLLAVLTACGGGGGGSTTTPAATTPTTPTDSVTTGASTTVAALGATAMTATNATSTAYNVVADIGDTWIVEFDTTGNAYRVLIQSTQFSLTNTTGTFTSTTSGNYITYNMGTAGTVYVDTRTKAINGNMTVGTKSTTVSGTGYKISNLTNLAGTYNFAYATRNQSNGADTDRGLGEMKIAGTSAYLCTNGKVNTANTCDAIVSGVTPELNTATLSLSGGSIIVSVGGAEWGRGHVHAGDLGAALIVDRYGRNGSGIMRVGTLSAIKSQTLPSTAFDGNWSCNRFGAPQFTASVSGTSVTVTDMSNISHSETIVYNSVAGSTAQIAAPGWINAGTAGAAVSTRLNILPLSSSVTVLQSDNNTLSTCRRTN